MFITGVVNANSCVVFLYHHVSNTGPKSTSISPELFEEQLQYLQENDFQVLSLKSMLSGLKNNTLPNKCVVLTADDAYTSIAKNAYPLLQKYQIPMSVFVSTNAIDQKYRAMMSWQQMRQIQGENISFYNHFSSHKHLLDLSKKQIIDEINNAQKRLNQELKVTDKILAYPFGEANIEIANQVQKMGYTAFSQHSGVVSNGSDLQNLPRFPMASNFAKMTSFKLKVNTLPMPIISKRHHSIVNQNPPKLVINFQKIQSKSAQKNFNCFARVGTNIIWKDNKTVQIQAKKSLIHRRSKYNCTMPSTQKSRYYWYSVQWIRADMPE